MTIPQFNADLLELAIDTVTISEPGTLNARGEATPQNPVTYKARVEYEPKQIRGNTGEEVIARATTYVLPVTVDDNDNLTYLTDLPTITTDHFITLPDGSTPPIIRVDKLQWEDMSHLIVYT